MFSARVVCTRPCEMWIAGIKPGRLMKIVFRVCGQAHACISMLVAYDYSCECVHAAFLCGLFLCERKLAAFSA